MTILERAADLEIIGRFDRRQETVAREFRIYQVPQGFIEITMGSHKVRVLHCHIEALLDHTVLQIDIASRPNHRLCAT